MRRCMSVGGCAKGRGGEETYLVTKSFHLAFFALEVFLSLFDQLENLRLDLCAEVVACLGNFGYADKIKVTFVGQHALQARHVGGSFAYRRIGQLKVLTGPRDCFHTVLNAG